MLPHQQFLVRSFLLFFCCSPPSFVLFLLCRPREGSWSLHKSCMLLRSIAIGSAGERRLPRSPEPARLPLTKGVRGEGQLSWVPWPRCNLLLTQVSREPVNHLSAPA